MIYSNLIIQKIVWKKLKKYSNKEKLPNAFLFHGNNGSGKEGHALEFASLINCLNKKNNDSCSNCSSCKKMIHLQHGNLKIIHPLPASKIKKNIDSPFNSMTKSELEDYRIIIEKKSADPYYKIDIPKSNSISINSIRYLKKELSMSTIEKGWNIILILNAEKLCYPNNTSANVLLKILEEPPEKTLFILITENYSKIINTIKSRCQEIYFPPLNEQEIHSILNDHLPKTDKDIIASISGGNLLRARRLENNLNLLYNDLKLFINAFYKLDSKYDNLIIQKISSLKTSDQEELTFLFKIIIIYFKDLFVFSKSNSIKYIVYKNLDTHYQKIVTHYNSTKWNSCITILENTLNNIYRNSSIPLSVNGMLIEIRETINNKDSKPFSINKWLGNN